jgi:hypothetical protein
MPSMSRKYCKSTPVSKMGFSQRSSCKAQGLIKRSDGTLRKSKKYTSAVKKLQYKRKSRTTRHSLSRSVGRRK